MTVAVDDDVFASLVEPLRRELTVHCYRMAGSIHDAEDLVQETYLRAWRGFHNFENRSSVQRASASPARIPTVRWSLDLR